MQKKFVGRPYETEIDIDTANGNRIDHYQGWNTFAATEYAKLRKHYKGRFPGIVERNASCTNVYNCHGMVFAARRAFLHNAATVRQILKEDSYIAVASNAVLPGDIVLYVSNGDVQHSGIIIDAQPLQEITIGPKLVSKWGHWGEVIHHLKECPYFVDDPDVKIEYHRVSR